MKEFGQGTYSALAGATLKAPTPTAALLIFSAFLANCALPSAASPAAASPLVAAITAQSDNSAQCSLTLKQDQLLAHFRDGDSDMEYAWSPPKRGSSNWTGDLSISSVNAPPVRWDNSAHAIATNGDELRVVSAHWVLRQRGAGMQVALNTGITINLNIQCLGRFLAIHVTAPPNSVRELTFGQIPQDGETKPLLVPYYPFDIQYREADGIFTTGFFDWTRSNASTQAFPRLFFGLRTNGTRLAPDDTLFLAASRQIEKVFPPQLNPRSAYAEDLSGRVILDVWDSGQFSGVASGLRNVRDLGLSKCLVIIHWWQHFGFDNGLPTVMPASESQGGDEGLQKIAKAAQELGCKFALHQNFVDYYPNYPGYKIDDVALKYDGHPVDAWLNRRVNVRAQATRPDRFVSISSKYSPSVHDTFNTTASYIDQNSGLFPWWRSDMASERQGAGQFWPFVKYSKLLWQNERKIHGGPVLGEGMFNFFWAGNIDGVEAQFDRRFGSNNIDSPLFVDFDLKRIHGWSVDHGMGYYDRWTQSYLVSSGNQHQLQQDIYRMQTIAFGHAPFLSGTDWHDPNAVWIEANLIAPVAERYGTTQAEKISYLVHNQWVTTEKALKFHNLYTVKVNYSNGLEVIANGGSVSVTAGSYNLPRGGWIASGTNFKAVSGLIGSERIDFVDSAGIVLANARSRSGAAIDFGPLVTDGGISLNQDQGRWTLHVAPDGNTHVVRLKTSRWKPPKTVTASCGNTIRRVIRPDSETWTFDFTDCKTFKWESP